jgi:hypothetical protein
MATTLPDYQGWTNRPTWAVVLHLNNEQGSQDWAREIGKQALKTALETAKASDPPVDVQRRAARLCGESIREALEEQASEVCAQDTGLTLDLATWALAIVDWDEIGAAFTEE